MFAEIIDSWVNGQKKQAYEQFQELTDDEQHDLIDILADDGAWYAPYMLGWFLKRSMGI